MKNILEWIRAAAISAILLSIIAVLAVLAITAVGALIYFFVNLYYHVIFILIGIMFFSLIILILTRKV